MFIESQADHHTPQPPMSKPPIASSAALRPFVEPDLANAHAPVSVMPSGYERQGAARAPRRPEIRFPVKPGTRASSPGTQSKLNKQDALDPDYELVKDSLGREPAYQWIASHLFCFVGELVILAAILLAHHDVWMLALVLATFGVIRSRFAGSPLLHALGLKNTSIYLVIFALPVIGSLALFKLSMDSHNMMK